jgi:hypothetical protein
VRLLFTSRFDRAFHKARVPFSGHSKNRLSSWLKTCVTLSLRAKKYNEAEDKWQARVNRDWRFYFRIVDDSYIVTDIMRHPK